MSLYWLYYHPQTRRRARPGYVWKCAVDTSPASQAASLPWAPHGDGLPIPETCVESPPPLGMPEERPGDKDAFAGAFGPTGGATDGPKGQILLLVAGAIALLAIVEDL